MDVLNDYARLVSRDSLPVSKCRPEPDYFVKPSAPALLLAAALIGLSTPAAAQTTTTAPDCASTTGRMSVSTTPAQALSDQGFCNGIEFTADGVVNVAEAAKNRIGTSTIPANPAADRRAVSVRTGAAATGNPDGRGTLNFSVDATVQGRVGDALTQANADNDRRIFKAAPSGRLNLIRIGSSASMATPTVTFTTPPKGFVFDRTTSRSANISRFVREGIGVGGVGAKRLQFETDGTVVLAEQSTHSFPTFYDIDQVLTQMNGQGALILKNNNSSVFRGTIGAPGKKLKSVTISSDLISNGLVRILGHIYANTIWLNNRTMRPGANPSGLLRLSGSGFDTPQPADPYMVDADVKTRFNTRGTLEIDVGAYYDLRGQIGMNGSELINVNLQPNARAIVHKDIYSEDVYMYSKSTLTVQKNLMIAGRLTAYNRSSVSRGLSSTIIRGGTTLALGKHTLSVKGAVTFTNDVPGNPHTLSLTLDGKPAPGMASNGHLDAGANPVILTPDLNIAVMLKNPDSIRHNQEFPLVSSGGGSGGGDLPIPAMANVTLNPAPTPAANPVLHITPAHRGMPGGAVDGKTLVLKATRPRQVLGMGIPPSGVGLSARGQVNGLRFDADARVNVADGEMIGALGGDMISISTGNTTRGAVVFTGARASVEGRIGVVLNEVKMFAGGNDTVFKAMAPDSRLKLIQIGSSGSSATPRVTFKVPPRPVSMADPFAVAKGLGLGNISTPMLNFASDGTVVLEQPPGHRYPTFYAIDTITRTGAQGTGKGSLII